MGRNGAVFLRADALGWILIGGILVDWQGLVATLLYSVSKLILLVQVDGLICGVGQLQALHQVVFSTAVICVAVGVVGADLRDKQAVGCQVLRCVNGTPPAELGAAGKARTGQLLGLTDLHGAAGLRDLEVDGQTVGGHIVSGGIVVIVGEDVALGIFDSKAPVILSKTVLTADLIDLDIISDVHGCAELCLCGIVLADLAAQIGTLAPEHGAFPGGDNNVFKVAVHSGHGELLHGMAATAGVLIPEAVV